MHPTMSGGDATIPTDSEETISLVLAIGWMALFSCAPLHAPYLRCVAK
eukprot:COSAG05_NODE_2141_length_3486_cov_4.423679_4_plen_48_part_00